MATSADCTPDAPSSLTPRPIPSRTAFPPRFRSAGVSRFASTKGGEPMASTVMTREERETFLTGVHVGVVAIEDPGRGPVTVPIWYDYTPGGELRFVTGQSSRKGRLLAKGRRVSMCVQTETPPYKYVSVEGEVLTIAPADLERDVRPVA